MLHLSPIFKINEPQNKSLFLNKKFSLAPLNINLKFNLTKDDSLLNSRIMEHRFFITFSFCYFSAVKKTWDNTFPQNWACNFWIELRQLVTLFLYFGYLRLAHTHKKCSTSTPLCVYNFVYKILKNALFVSFPFCLHMSHSTQFYFSSRLFSPFFPYTNDDTSIEYVVIFFWCKLCTEEAKKRTLWF